jgi:thymidylate kinase
VAAGYREIAERFADRVRLVAGDGSVDEVHARVMAAVGPFL